MNYNETIASTLIALGGLIMLISIFKYRILFNNAKHLLSEGKRHLIISYCTHQVLMIFFLMGYIAVLASLLMNISIISTMFTGLIFFFGSVFVFIGIDVQSYMVESIKKEHEKILIKNQQLIQTENVTIFALAYQAEMRDLETGKHLERTASYVRLISTRLSAIPKYNQYITDEYIDDIVKATPLHDIGKVGIPDHILKKPGKLTSEEFEIMKKHCEFGARILETAEKKLTFKSFLKVAIKLVASHHEKWDGSGYPQGLKGTDIPLSARILAIADVYDALRSVRCYKDAMAHSEAVRIISSEKGRHFDPDVVDAFISLEKEFERISNEMSD